MLPSLQVLLCARLSSWWDISTAVYAEPSINIDGSANGAAGLTFSADGRNMYVTSTSSKIQQFSLSSPWGVSTAVWLASFVASMQDTNPNGVRFSDDGTKMYVLGGNTKTIYQYALSTAWDVSTASFASKSLSLSVQGGAVGFAVAPNGMSIYACSGAESGVVYQYSMTTAWDLATGAYANKSCSTGSQDTAPCGLSLSDDGRAIYVLGNSTDTVYQYAMATAFDVSTASLAKSKLVSAQGTSKYGLALSTGGTKMFVGDDTGGISRVYSYSLG